MFKALQHIRVKSYKLCMNLVDFGGTAQKEQLVYLARGAMSMSELMANPAHSTIIGIRYFGMGQPCQILLKMLARRHAFDIFERDAVGVKTGGSRVGGPELCV